MANYENIIKKSKTMKKTIYHQFIAENHTQLLHFTTSYQKIYEKLTRPLKSLINVIRIMKDLNPELILEFDWGFKNDKFYKIYFVESGEIFKKKFKDIYREALRLGTDLNESEVDLYVDGKKKNIKKYFQREHSGIK